MHSPLTLDQRFDDPRFSAALLKRLPEYLAKQRWFTSKGKAITNCKIREAYPVTRDTTLVVMEIHFGDKSTEYYQMPLAQLTHTDDQRRYLKDNATMVLLRVPGGPFIVDAVPLPAFRRALYELVRRGADTPEGINCEAGQLLKYAPDSADS
ncbi:MAG: hypothetical protein AB8H12_13510, partial [Lewinella sp.]